MVMRSPDQVLADYQQSAFSLRQHLQAFLNLDADTLEAKLIEGTQALAELGHHFEWNQVNDFYRDQVGTSYLFDLGAWHLTSQDHISGTLRLLNDHGHGRVLDFGGGIGTHAIAASLCPRVTEVVYCDINPVNREFVAFRAKALGLSHKLKCYEKVPADASFDTITCFDVLEHLAAPTQQLLHFHEWLGESGKLIVNWYFFKGFQQEYPFHLDDPAIVTDFFQTLQSHFLEVFHPYFVTARCYQKQPSKVSSSQLLRVVSGVAG